MVEVSNSTSEKEELTRLQEMIEQIQILKGRWLRVITTAEKKLIESEQLEKIKLAIEEINKINDHGKRVQELKSLDCIILIPGENTKLFAAAIIEEVEKK